MTKNVETVQDRQNAWAIDYFMPALAAGVAMGRELIEDVTSDPEFGALVEMAKQLWSFASDTIPTQTEPMTPILHVNTPQGPAITVIEMMLHPDVRVRRVAREKVVPSLLKKLGATSALLATEAWVVEVKEFGPVEATNYEDARKEVGEKIHAPPSEDDRRQSVVSAIIVSERTELAVQLKIMEGDGRKIKAEPTVLVLRSKGTANPMMPSIWYSERTPDLPEDIEVVGVNEAAE